MIDYDAKLYGLCEKCGVVYHKDGLKKIGVKRVNVGFTRPVYVDCDRYVCDSCEEKK